MPKRSLVLVLMFFKDFRAVFWAVFKGVSVELIESIEVFFASFFMILEESLRLDEDSLEFIGVDLVLFLRVLPIP